MSPWPAVQHLSFTVSDPRRSRDFYRDLLGFRDIGTSGGIAELVMGETKLVLLRADGAPPVPKDLHFGFRAASLAEVDDWGRRARAAACAIDFGPAVAEWGGYVVYFRDPDGYQIEIWSDE